MSDLTALEGLALPPTVYHVEREKIAEFARAIGDTETTSDVAPPTFAALYALAPLGQFLALTAVAPHTGRVIHVDQELEFLRLARAGDVITTEGRVDRVRERGGGCFVSISAVSTGPGGDEIARAQATLLVGGAK